MSYAVELKNHCGKRHISEFDGAFKFCVLKILGGKNKSLTIAREMHFDKSFTEFLKGFSRSDEESFLSNEVEILKSIFNGFIFLELYLSFGFLNPLVNLKEIFVVKGVFNTGF